MSSETRKSRRIFSTIGVRLTLRGVVTTLSVCLILNVILYLGMHHFMLKEVDRILIGELRELSAEVREHGSDYRRAARAIRQELKRRQRVDFRFRLIDEDGNTLIRSDPDLGFSSAYLARVSEGPARPRPVTLSVTVSRKPRSFRAHSEQLRTEAGGSVTAIAFYTLRSMDRSMTWLLRVSWIGLVVAALVSLIGNGLLAKRSLLPVKAMTAAADAITEDSLDARIELSGSDDEMDRLARVLNAMLDRIEGHVRRVRQFTADASHELRSPLAALRGSAEVCLSRPRSMTELRSAIENSMDQYDRLQRITEDLLLLARVDAGEFRPEEQPVALEDVVQDMFDLYRPLASERDLDLKLTRLESGEIRGDGGRLRQLIGNLLDNAIRFSLGPGTVEVALRVSERCAEVSIRDTGVGIAAEDLPKIYDRFFRADPSRAGGGTGLGLAIAKWIVEAHGGQIEITSRPGHGTTARVTLPRLS